MRSDEAVAALKTEFRELNEPGIILEKEVYAHFGLLFMKFSLVEHSLINSFAIYSSVAEYRKSSLRSKAEWGEIFDRCESHSKALTLGNLVRKLTSVAEFASSAIDLSRLRSRRNYFAHQFMREESPLFSSEEGCWLLLTKIADMRHWLLRLEGDLQVCFRRMCVRLNFPVPDNHSVDNFVKKYIQDAHLALREGQAKVGWDTDAL